MGGKGGWKEEKREGGGGVEFHCGSSNRGEGHCFVGLRLCQHMGLYTETIEAPTVCYG